MMILGIAILAMVIAIVFFSTTEKDELEAVIDIFDKSNDITVISSKLNDYIKNNHYTEGKHFLMFSIIRSLTTKKRIALARAMRRNFIKDDIQITMDIIVGEIADIENEITTYRSDLNSKLFQILQLDNGIEIIV